MAKEFRIELTNEPPHGVYFPGMAVTGTVICTTDGPKDLDQILVTLRGRARVSFGEGRNSPTYHATEDYVSCSAVLWDKTENGQGERFPVGNHRFDFSFQLKGDNCGTNMPYSFTGSTGSISYTLDATIAKKVIQLNFDKKAVATLNVGNLVKIDRPQLLSPLAMEVHKTLCCLFCASGPIVITARIPRTGFCIGHDSIPVEITVENGSSRQIQHLQIALTRKVNFLAQGRQRNDRKTIQTVTTRAVSPNETALLRPDPLVIPSDTIATQNSSSILTINYFVVVKASLFFAISPCIDLPIVVGNAPLEDGSGSGPLLPSEPAVAPVDGLGISPAYAPSNQMPIGFVDPIKKI